MQSYSLQAGAVRRNFGQLSNDYGKPAATGTYRRGLSPTLTAEATAETTAGASMAGAGVALNVADLFILNAAAAGSTGSAGAGTQFTLGAQRLGSTFSFGASATMADRNFRDVAAMNGAPAPQFQLSASVGLSLGQLGSVSVVYAGVDTYIAPAPIALYVPPGASFDQGPVLPAGGTISFQPAQHTHILSANYSVQLGDVSIYATGYRELTSSGGQGINVGLTIPLGSRSAASGSASRGSGGGVNQIQVAQSTTAIGDFGYQAFASRGASSHEFAVADYKASWALLTTGIDRIGR